MHAHERGPGRRDAQTCPASPHQAAKSPQGLLALQRLVGNAAVAGLMRRAAVDKALGSSGAPMSGHVRADMEQRLGADFSDVRVHTGSEASSAARSVQARAFTAGSHIVFGQGHFDTASAPGRHVLAHELAHVVQQRTGPVSGTDTGDGVKVSDPGDAYERAAEADATRAMRGEAAPERDLPAAGSAGSGQEVVQRAVGAEVEEPNWTVVDAKKKTPVKKGVPLVHRPHFQLQAEFGGAEKSNIEMVTNPPGVLDRGEWNQMRDGMIGLEQELRVRGSASPFSAAELQGGVGGYELRPSPLFTPSLQITAGVPLAAVHELLVELSGVEARVTSRKDGVAPKPEPGQSGAELGLDADPSGELLGFITMLENYLRQGAQSEWRTFPKAVFPVMARTDFAKMFTMLPSSERDAIAADLDAWVQLVTGRAGVDDPTGGGTLLEGWFYDPQDSSPAEEITTTRRDWLTSMASQPGEQGRDKLTVHGKLGSDAQALGDAEQARRLAAGVREDVDPGKGDKTRQRPQTEEIAIPEDEQLLRGLIEDLRELYGGLGALGSRTDTVQYSGRPTPAVIVEIRDPGPGNWKIQMDRVYEAIDRAIRTGGDYENKLDTNQKRLREEADQQRQAAIDARKKMVGVRVLSRVKTLLRQARSIRPKRK